ncbi:MAG: hypothetical protein H6578_04490 [Chitinophagales bacterium]|nr:hypothetical protein [Chitinophagales bacterium]
MYENIKNIPYIWFMSLIKKSGNRQGCRPRGNITKGLGNYSFDVGPVGFNTSSFTDYVLDGTFTFYKLSDKGFQGPHVSDFFYDFTRNSNYSVNKRSIEQLNIEYGIDGGLGKINYENGEIMNYYRVGASFIEAKYEIYQNADVHRIHIGFQEELGGAFIIGGSAGFRWQSTLVGIK